MKKVALIFLFVFAVNVDSSFGCSLTGKLLTDFDETEYVFIGEVLGYTSPIEVKGLRTPAVGLIVKVRENVYLPKTPKLNFELFPIELWADCSNAGSTLEGLKQRFPVNSEVRVVAKAAKILPQLTDDKTIRLEERPAEIGSIALNVDEKGKQITTVAAVFDYRKYKRDIHDSGSEYFLPSFEIRKDLLRLRNSKTQAEKNSILDRLFDMPYSVLLDFRAVFDAYTANRTESEKYYEERIRLTDPPFFNLYQIEKTILAELRKRKVNDQTAKTVFGEALNEVMDLEADGDTETIMLGLKVEDMLNRCLQILKRINDK